MTISGSVDIVEQFDLRHAFENWFARGVREEDLIMILRRDLEHCRNNLQPGSARNIERMLEILEA